MKTVSGIDREALEISNKLMKVLGEMVQWRGILSDDEEDLFKALVKYTESMKKEDK